MPIDMNQFDPRVVQQATLDSLNANAAATYLDKVKQFKLAAADYLYNCEICSERGIPLPKFNFQIPMKETYPSLSQPPTLTNEAGLALPVFTPQPTASSGGIVFQAGVPDKNDQILNVLQQMAVLLNKLEAKILG